MRSVLPESIVEFVSFLEGKGLVCQSRNGPDPVFFGNTLLQYGNDIVRIRLASDRSVWAVDIADAGQPDEWYDVAIIRDLLVGSGEDILPLPDQITFIRTNWQAILDCFNPVQCKETHARLSSLRMERAKRLFPTFHPK